MNPPARPAPAEQPPGNVFIAGAGGFGAEIVCYLRQALALAPVATWKVAGVVDDYLRGPAPQAIEGIPFLGRIADVADVRGACFVVAAGQPRFRRETIEQLDGLGLPLHTLVHPTAIVAPSAVIGDGVVIAPFSIVNAGAYVGRGSVLNVYCSVGHDARLGDFSVMSPYAALNGWASVGRQSFLGTRATVFPKVQVGERCTIDSHSYVKSDTADRMIVSIRGESRTLLNRLER
jgi:sugar O-acyltransferase (sialic acid O-acetyltransferase NeuD family)